MDEEDLATTIRTISSQTTNNGVLHHEGPPPVEGDKILEEPCYTTHTLTAMLTTQEVHEQNMYYTISLYVLLLTNAVGAETKKHSNFKDRKK